MSLSDARRMYVLLRDAGAEGCHSHQLRRQGVSGNPSQRAKDIVSHGVAISTRREAVGRRPGSRYWLAEHAPSDAVAVRANRDVEVGGGASGGASVSSGPSEQLSPAADLSITPSPPDTHEPVAIVRDGDSFSEVPVRACRRCESTGQLASGECPACFGTGVIARARVNSWQEQEAA